LGDLEKNRLNCSNFIHKHTTRDMSNHFSATVKESISYSAEEAWRTNSSAITSAHLLLGLLKVQDYAMSNLRENLGSRLSKLTTTLETMIQSTGRDNAIPRRQRGRLFRLGMRLKSRRLSLDEEAVRIIRQSAMEASDQQNIEPRHLMLAILHDKESSVASVLGRFEIDDSFFKEL
jgi:ATP-dependent Clp protease ATP-binding subunit ClpA